MAGPSPARRPVRRSFSEGGSLSVGGPLFPKPAVALAKAGPFPASRPVRRSFSEGGSLGAGWPLSPSARGANLSYHARVAESADARDLKSLSPKGECGFDPHPGH